MGAIFIGFRARRAGTRRPNTPPRTRTFVYGLWRVLKSAPRRERMTNVTRRWSRPMSRRSPLWSGAASPSIGRFSRVSPGNSRRRWRDWRGRFHAARGRALQSGIAQAARAIFCSARWTSRRQKNRDRSLVDSASVLDELAEGGNAFAAAHSRMASALQAEIDLQRRPARLRQSANAPRPHMLCALAATTTGRLSSSEPNLQNIPVRNDNGAQDPRGLRRGSAARVVDLGGLFADRAAAARACRRIFRSSKRPSPRGSTFTR